MRPPGNQDPPTLSSGILTGLASYPTKITLDPTKSSATMHLSFDDVIGVHHDDTETTAIRGDVTLYGIPCPGAECGMRLDATLFPADFTFHFDGIPDVRVSETSMVGGAGDLLVHVGSNGNGLIPQDALAIVVDGKRTDLPLIGPSVDTRHTVIATNRAA